MSFAPTAGFLSYRMDGLWPCSVSSTAQSWCSCDELGELSDMCVTCLAGQFARGIVGSNLFLQITVCFSGHIGTVLWFWNGTVVATAPPVDTHAAPQGSDGRVASALSGEFPATVNCT